MKNTAQSLIGVIAFVLICFFAVRPLLERIIRIESEKDNYSEYHLCFVLVGAMICACITDLLGVQSIVGAFVFGLIMPNGEFGDVLLDRLDDFVSGIMLPFFFVSWGVKIDFTKIMEDTSWFVVILVICFACMAKILSSLIISILFKMPLLDGVALGVLMNTKGILALVILNTGWNKKVLNNFSYWGAKHQGSETRVN
jgi:Kef-type K+ transport system membrane component KefB